MSIPKKRNGLSIKKKWWGGGGGNNLTARPQIKRITRHGNNMDNPILPSYQNRLLLLFKRKIIISPLKPYQTILKV